MRGLWRRRALRIVLALAWASGALQPALAPACAMAHHSGGGTLALDTGEPVSPAARSSDAASSTPGTTEARHLTADGHAALGAHVAHNAGEHAPAPVPCSCLGPCHATSVTHMLPAVAAVGAPPLGPRGATLPNSGNRPAARVHYLLPWALAPPGGAEG